jgi:hypothetical protein
MQIKKTLYISVHSCKTAGTVKARLRFAVQKQGRTLLVLAWSQRSSCGAGSAIVDGLSSVMFMACHWTRANKIPAILYWGKFIIGMGKPLVPLQMAKFF